MNHVIGKCTVDDYDINGEPITCDAQRFEIIYDKFSMNSTIVTEFNLFCNEEYKV